MNTSNVDEFTSLAAHLTLTLQLPDFLHWNRSDSLVAFKYFFRYALFSSLSHFQLNL